MRAGGRRRVGLRRRRVRGAAVAVGEVHVHVEPRRVDSRVPNAGAGELELRVHELPGALQHLLVLRTARCGSLYCKTHTVRLYEFEFE